MKLIIRRLAYPHFIAWSMLGNNAQYEMNESLAANNHFYSGNKVLSLSYDRNDRDEICSCNEAFKFAFKILGTHSCDIQLDKENF